MNRIPFMKTPTTAHTTNDSLFQTISPGKDPSIKTIEEEFGKLSLLQRQFKNDTIEELDRRIQRGHQDAIRVWENTYLEGVRSWEERYQNAIRTWEERFPEGRIKPETIEELDRRIQRGIQDVIRTWEQRPTPPAEMDPQHNQYIKDLLGKNMNALRQDLAKIRDSPPPIYPTYDREFTELKNLVSNLHGHLVTHVPSKTDIHSLFGILGNMKTPLDELKRLVSSSPSFAVEKPNGPFVKNPQDPSDMVLKTLRELGGQLKMLQEGIQGQQKSVKDTYELYLKNTKDLISGLKNDPPVEPILKITMDRLKTDLNTLLETKFNTLGLDAKLKGTTDRLKTDLNALLETKLKGVADRIKIDMNVVGIETKLEGISDRLKNDLNALLETKLKGTADRIKNDMNTALETKLSAGFDRIKNELVVSLAERLEEVLMQTKKLENYMMESRTHTLDSQRILSKRIDDFKLEIDPRDMIEQSIQNFLSSHRSETIGAVSVHISEDMITVLQQLKEKWLSVPLPTCVSTAIQTDLPIIPNTNTNPSMITNATAGKPNPFSPFKKN